MKSLRLLVALSLSVFAPAAFSKPITITFIHYNDLHAHLTPHWDVVPDAPYGQTATKTKIVERGGIARAATLIKRIRQDNPNSLLMNIGDTYHGGVEALFTNGNAIVEPMNALGVDVGVPGNWDFAYGPIVTRLRYVDLKPMEKRMLSRVNDMMTPVGEVKRPNFPNLAANVTIVQPAWKAGQSFLPPTLTKEVAGVKVGFIGITSDIVPRMHEMLAMGLDFLQGEHNYRDLINRHAKALRDQGVDVVVVMSELGIQKDYRLAQIVEKNAVDVFFSAHTHETTFTPLTSSSGAYVVEAGNDGYVGRMDVTVDDGKVTTRHWKLLALDRSIPEDAAMKKLVAKAREPFLAPQPNIKLPMMMQEQMLTEPIDKVVANVKGVLDRRNALESGFNDAFSEALRKRGKTDIAITPGFRFDAVIAEPGAQVEDNTVAKGAVTVEDLYRFFPVSYTIGTARVSADRLRSIIEDALNNVFSPNVFEQSGGWFEGLAGVRASIDLAQPKGSRVRSLVLKSGAELKGNEEVSVTGCLRPMDKDDVMCSYPGFSKVEPFDNPATGKPWTVTDLFADMLRHGEVVAVSTHLTDLSRTPMWPASPFVQPLSGVGKASASSEVSAPANDTVAEDKPKPAERKGPLRRFMERRNAQ